MQLLVSQHMMCVFCMHIIKCTFKGKDFHVSAFYLSSGKIPLRELVYRVIDLPPSMRPLVYDFGQLNTDTERDYTLQIVQDHVRKYVLAFKPFCDIFLFVAMQVKKHVTLSQKRNEIIPAVARVFAWSQMYMRHRNVSFYSILVCILLVCCIVG